MKIAFIFVLFKTPKEEVKRLEKEIAALNIKDVATYFIDNTKNNQGYAQGINNGLKMALEQNADLFIIANPDISLNNLKRDILEGSKKFDIWGLAMKQNGKTYYGGKLDKWRMSGGLNIKKPPQRFWSCDFVSGSLMCIKKSVIEKIGYLNERYFMYYEDVDYCFKARKQGFKVGIDSEISYVHYELSKKNVEKKILLARNRLRFFLKYSDTKQKLYEILRLPKTLIQERSLIIDTIRKRKFFLNFLSLNISSGLNKVFNFILFIFLLRYLSISDYGIYTLVWAQVGLLSPFLDLGTTTYGLVNLPDKKISHFNSLLSFRLFLAGIVFLLTLLLGVFFQYQTLLLFYIILTSFTIFSSMWSGSFLILTSIKEKNYQASIVSTVFNFTLIAILIASLLVFKNLLVIFIVVFILYNIYSVYNMYLIKQELGYLKLSFDYKMWLRILKKSYVFVLIAFFAGLYFKLDVVLLQILKSEKEVGIYSAGYKFFEALIFFASSYNFTAIPILAKIAKSSNEMFVKKIKKDAFFLLILGILVSGTVFIISPLILPFVLKNYSSDILAVLRIVIFTLPFILVSSVFFNALYILKKTYIVVILFIFQTVFNLVLNLIFIPIYSYYASATITLVGELINTIILVAIFLILKKHLGSINPLKNH